MLQLQSAFGVLALLAIAWALGENRRAVSLRQAAIGLAATLATAIVLLKLPVVARAFGAINDAVGAISAASRAGSSFVFGYIGGGTLPFDLKVPGADFILAFQALPIVLVMSVLTTLLFYVTPIMYPLDLVPDGYKQVLMLNPLAPLLEAWRALFVEGELPGIEIWPAAVFAAVAMVLGVWVFRATGRNMADAL